MNNASVAVKIKNQDMVKKLVSVDAPRNEILSRLKKQLEDGFNGLSMSYSRMHNRHNRS